MKKEKTKVNRSYSYLPNAISICTLTFVLIACNHKQQCNTNPIQSALLFLTNLSNGYIQGNQALSLHDNNHLLEEWQEKYNALDKAQANDIKNSSFVFADNNAVEEIAKDSIYIITIKVIGKNKPKEQKVKVVKTRGCYMIDCKQSTITIL